MSSTCSISSIGALMADGHAQHFKNDFKEHLANNPDLQIKIVFLAVLSHFWVFLPT